MKIMLFTFLFAVTFLNSEAQITFQKTYEGASTDRGLSIQPTNDGGYIIAGSTLGSIAGGNNFNLIKLDSEGSLLWAKVYGGGAYDFPTSVKQNNEGGYIVTGVTQSFGAGDMDIYLIKTNDIGDTLWTKTYGGPNMEWGYDVIQTNDGGYIVSGLTFSFGGCMYLIKTDDNGDTLWTKTYSSVHSGESIQQTTDGGYIIAGYTYNSSTDMDISLIKTDDMGDTLWTRTFGGASFDISSFVKQTNDGGYIIAGRTTSFGAGDEDIYLIKTDSTGDLIWTKTYGGTSNDGWSPDVQPTNDGGYIVCGNTDSFGAGSTDAYLIKTNDIGDIVWTKTYGGLGVDECYSVYPSLDGGYLAVGGTISFALNGDYDLYLIKTDSLGNSNCNESNPATISTVPFTQIMDSIVIVISSTNTIITSPATVVANGGAFTTLCTTVEIDEPLIISSENKLQAFPNPSHGNFKIAWNNTISKGLLKIYNVYGELIFSDKIINEATKTIILENSSQGIYFAKVFDGEKNYCTKISIE